MCRCTRASASPFIILRHIYNVWLLRCLYGFVHPPPSPLAPLPNCDPLSLSFPLSPICVCWNTIYIACIYYYFYYYYYCDYVLFAIYGFVQINRCFRVPPPAPIVSITYIDHDMYMLLYMGSLLTTHRIEFRTL